MEDKTFAVSFTKQELRTVEAALMLYRDDTKRLMDAHPPGNMRDTLLRQHLSAVGSLSQVRSALV